MTDETTDTSGNSPLPETVIERATMLTRRARDTVDENERTAYLADRDERLEAYDYTARVREGDTGDTLVLYPDEWVEDGTVRFDRIEDTARAVERSLSGPGSDADWDEIDRHNREIATRVRERCGDVHGDTAAAFADFMSNHYAKPIEFATADEREEFRREYFVRNAWPTDEQRERVDESIRLVVELAKAE